MPLTDDDKSWIDARLEMFLDALISELRIRFGETNGRLDRIDAKLTLHSKDIAAGTKKIAGFQEWTSEADADYTRLLRDLTDLKLRIVALEAKP